MSFLMSLNESYAQIRGQLLLMDPLLPINKVFSLISQEEKQKQVGSQHISGTDPSNSMAFHAKHEALNATPRMHKQQRKDRPFCTHCKSHGHTMEKYYKLHGFPPGFRHKHKFHVDSNALAITNQTSHDSSYDTTNNKDTIDVTKFFQHLDKTQCHNLLSLLSSHLNKPPKADDHASINSTSYTTGTCLSVSNTRICSSTKWLVDSGASRHICFDASEFTSIRPIQRSTVILPNHTSIPVHFSGEVKLNNHLTLHDVLYVPQFQYNLLSVSALSNMSQLILTFFPNHFIIQDLHHKKTIGRGNKFGDLYFL